MKQWNLGQFGSFLTRDVYKVFGIDRSHFCKVCKTYQKTTRLSHGWGQAFSLLNQLPEVRLHLPGTEWDCRHVRQKKLGLSVMELANLLLLSKFTIYRYEQRVRGHDMAPAQRFIIGCLATDCLRPQTLLVLVEYLAKYGDEQQKQQVPFYRHVLLGEKAK